MTLQQLHYIITIADTGSFSKAAEVLYVSQPSLSNAVKTLENELGIVIFFRSGKGVTLTNDGAEFLIVARQVHSQYEQLEDKYAGGHLKKKFSVSTQHYSFATKSFVEMVKNFDIEEYEFAIRETKTKEVIGDVASLKSEIGILYRSDFNRNYLTKLFRDRDLEFHHLIDCQAYVYLWRGHPLASSPAITFKDLEDYPCLSFDQGEDASFYLAEEILCEQSYAKLIKTNDRSTNLNLMKGLNAYCLCSGIICEELNGSDYVAVPFQADEATPNSVMEIGYIVKKNMTLSQTGEIYLAEIKKYLGTPAITSLASH